MTSTSRLVGRSVGRLISPRIYPTELHDVQCVLYDVLQNSTPAGLATEAGTHLSPPLPLSSPPVPFLSLPPCYIPLPPFHLDQLGSLGERCKFLPAAANAFFTILTADTMSGT